MTDVTDVTLEAGLCPQDLWRRFDQMTNERLRRRNAVVPDAQGRSLYVVSAYQLESSPPVTVAVPEPRVSPAYSRRYPNPVWHRHITGV